MGDKFAGLTKEREVSRGNTENNKKNNNESVGSVY